MKTAPSTAASQVYQLKITLKDSHPPIWRRVQVPAAINLRMLHKVIQAVMSWQNGHLHEFRIDGNFFGMPDAETCDIVTDEKAVPLFRAVKTASKQFTYVYDFGDDWHHEVLVEKIIPTAEGVHYPVCTGGKMAAPPDNSGAMWGYYDKLEILKHPEHPEHERIKEWMGKDWDPAAFSIESANAALCEMEIEEERLMAEEANKPKQE